MTKNGKKRILIAPLNWGIGHATRMIPVIRELEKQGAHTIIATDGLPAMLLKEHFPNSEHITLKSFPVQYSGEKKYFTAKILSQLPGILKTVEKEHKITKKIVEKHKIDAIISDNRYGVYSKKVPSVFITHQLHIKMPEKLQYFFKPVNKAVHLVLSRFDEIWVPDFEGKDNLSGELSHPPLKNQTVKYMGPLSRFDTKPDVSTENKKHFDIFASLSGPEPQRTLLEKALITQLAASRYTAVILQGKPGAVKPPSPAPNITLLPHVNDNDYLSLINNSSMMISRSGYSTIMDLYILGKKAVFIPTPGQTEQEYLAKRMKEKNICNSFSQDNFIIEQAIQEEKFYTGFPGTDFRPSCPDIIKDFLSKI